MRQSKVAPLLPIIPGLSKNLLSAYMIWNAMRSAHVLYFGMQ